jgi:hypothetical protein
LSRADDPEAVRIAVDGVHDYRTFFDQTGMGSGSNVGNMAGGSDEGKSLEDLFYQKEMELSKLAFTRQFTFSVVYSWVKLREQVCFLSSTFTNYTNSNTGNPQRHLDIRVYCSEPEGQDRQLHQRLLKLLCTMPLPLILVSSPPAFIPIC